MTDATLDAPQNEMEASFGDYFALLKPRVMILVVFTALVGLLAAPVPLHWVVAFASILFIAVGGGASGALNMWWDADIDRVMRRTQKRPIPSGRVSADEAKILGFALAGFSVVMLALAANLFAAALLAFTIFFYLVIYTIWLKRWTPQNIVIGGAAGAFPPMIGWACATGSVSIESVLMFALIFMWTPPHFWALALVKNDDYKAANIPMLPVVAGSLETRRQIVIYAVLLAPLAVVPSFIGMASVGYGVIAALAGLLFVAMSLQLFKTGDHKHAMRLFAYSIMYLFLLFLGLVIDHAVLGYLAGAA